MATFDNYYGLEPWSAIDIKERDWYVPELIRGFRQTSNYSQLVPVQVDFTAFKTKKIIWSGLWDLEPNINPIEARSLWLPTMHPDGFQLELTLDTYGGKIALHKYDEIVNYFTSGGRDARVLASLSRGWLTDSVVTHMEKQIRNAFMTLPIYWVQGGGSGFGSIEDTDLYDPKIAMDVSLEFAYNQVVDPNQANGISAVAFASPGIIYQAQQDSGYTGVAQYSEIGARSMLRYEMGAYKGFTRYVQHPINVLWNCGAITAQAPVSAAINAGDGAPDPATSKILKTYRVGQKAGPTRYIQLDTFTTGSISDLKVGDKVSIHVIKSDGATAPYDVVDAPIPTDGYKVDRIIHSIDTGNGRVTFTKPIQEDFTTEIETGIYAYLTKGLHIHACVVVSGPGSVVGGFAQPPQVMFPPAVDDRLAMYRVTWDSMHEYGLYRPEVGVVIFCAGYTSQYGRKTLGND